MRIPVPTPEALAVLFDAVVDRLPPREDRDLDAPLFAGFKGDNLRTAITRACRLTGTPHFSPYGLGGAARC